MKTQSKQIRKKLSVRKGIIKEILSMTQKDFLDEKQSEIVFQNLLKNSNYLKS